MTTAYQKVMSYLKTMGLGVEDLNSFSGRVSIQKVIYVLQQFDADLHYPFTWYAHGPYSPDLTRTLYNADPNEKQAIPNASPEELKITTNARNFLGADLYSVDLLELVASLIYLVNWSSNYDLNSKGKIISFLKEKKPQFSDAQIDQAWKKIEASDKWNSKLQQLQN